MRACSVDGCERPHLARGRCRKHYDAWARCNPDELNHDPPLPAGLLDAVTARLDAVHDGLDAEAEASTLLRDLIDNLH